jgi:hypothetical protein
MDGILQQLIDSDFAGLHGLSVDGSIPVTEQLANEILALALQGNPQLEYCRVRFNRENRVTCDVKSPQWPWPFSIKLRLFGAVDLSGSATVRAFLENHLLLGQLGSLFKALPEEIKIYKDQVSVDLGAFLNSREQKAFLDLVESAEIRTQAGRIFFDIKIRK